VFLLRYKLGFIVIFALVLTLARPQVVFAGVLTCLGNTCEMGVSDYGSATPYTTSGLLSNYTFTKLYVGTSSDFSDHSHGVWVITQGDARNVITSHNSGSYYVEDMFEITQISKTNFNFSYEDAVWNETGTPWNFHSSMTTKNLVGNGAGHCESNSYSKYGYACFGAMGLGGINLRTPFSVQVELWTGVSSSGDSYISVTFWLSASDKIIVKETQDIITFKSSFKGSPDFQIGGECNLMKSMGPYMCEGAVWLGGTDDEYKYYGSAVADITSISGSVGMRYWQSGWTPLKDAYSQAMGYAFHSVKNVEVSKDLTGKASSSYGSELLSLLW